jgi:hypothetical protein
MSCVIPPDIFGKPREGVHSWRVFDFAAVDILGIIALAFVFTIRARHLFFPVLGALFVVAELFHYFIGADTQFMRLIGASQMQKN